MPPAAPSTAAPRRGRVLAAVTAAQMLSVGAATTVGVALPSLARDLDADGAAQQWVVDSFVLVFASLLVAGGVLGDRRGRRRVLLVGLGLFAAGSAICALAPGVGVLLLGRVVQALGPPLVLPASLAIVTSLYADPVERSRAIGLWGAGSGLGIALGPLLGGALVDAGSWRWVFLANVPIALGVAVIIARSVPADRPARPDHAFDGVAAVQLTAAVALLTFAVIEGRELGYTSAATLGCLAVTAALLVAFVRREGRHPAPLVELGLLRHRPFVAANLGGATLFGVLTGLAVYFSVFFQQVQGRSAVEAGLCLLPQGAAVALFAPIAGRLAGRFGARLPMLLGLGVALAAALALLRLEPTTPIGSVWWAFALLGAGTGLALPPMTITALASVPAAQAGMGSALHNASRQLGQTFGVAVLGAIVLHGARGDEPLVGPAARAWVDGLHAALAVSAGALLLAAVVVAVLVPRRTAAAGGLA